MNEKKGISWLSLYMYAYLIVGTIVLSNTSLGGEIPDEYKSNLTLYWGEKACIISVCALALYNFLALFKRWPNAVQISNTYLGVIILINGFNLLLGNINTTDTEEGQLMARSIIGIITAVGWIVYFRNSKEINALFPKEERRLLGRDVLIICAAIVVPVILLLLGVSSNKNGGFTSVMDDTGIETGKETYSIDETKLKEGEITDGITIIKIPEGVVYEKTELEDGHIAFNLSDSKTEPTYSIQFFSGCNTEMNSYIIQQIWEEYEDQTLKDAYVGDIRTDDYTNDFWHCSRRVSRYQLENTIIRDYTVLYDYPAKKACVLNAYFQEGTDTPIEKIIEGIRFRQE